MRSTQSYEICLAIHQQLCTYTDLNIHYVHVPFLQPFQTLVLGKTGVDLTMWGLTAVSV